MAALASKGSLSDSSCSRSDSRKAIDYLFQSEQVVTPEQRTHPCFPKSGNNIGLVHDGGQELTLVSGHKQGLLPGFHKDTASAIKHSSGLIQNSHLSLAIPRSVLGIHGEVGRRTDCVCLEHNLRIQISLTMCTMSSVLETEQDVATARVLVY